MLVFTILQPVKIGSVLKIYLQVKKIIIISGIYEARIGS